MEPVVPSVPSSGWVQQPAVKEPYTRLSKLTLRNFKRFGDEPVEIDLADVTLLFGANSSGKSSVLQALLMLAQSWRRPQDIATLTTDGEYVNLGGWSNVLHQHGAGGQPAELAPRPQLLEIGLEMIRERESQANETLSVTLFFGQVSKDAEIGSLLHLACSRISGEHSLRVHFDCHRDVAGDLRIQWPSSRETYAIPESFSDVIDSAVAGWEFPDVDVKDYAFIDVAIVDDQYDRRVDVDCEIDRDRFDQDMGLFDDDISQNAPEDDGNSVGLFAHMGASEFWGHVKQAMARPIKPLLQDTFFAARAILISLRHIGKLRLPTPRFVNARWGARADQGVGSRGEHLGTLLLTDSSLVSALNQMLECAYAADRAAGGGFPLYQLRATLDPLLHSAGGTILLEHSHEGKTLATVGVEDVGSGIGQLLPILAEWVRLAREAGLVRNKRAVLVVEQPELHLHPAQQSVLFTLLCGLDPLSFKSLDLGFEFTPPQVILETHSEHMALRLRRMVREKTLASDAAVFAVIDSAATGGATVVRVGVTPRGKFDRLWPRGFFAERLGEE